jgi:hypothetical protein
MAEAPSVDVFPAREVAIAEIKAAHAELTLLSNLLALTSGAAGTAAGGAVLFETANAVSSPDEDEARRVQDVASRRTGAARKRETLEAAAALLSAHADDMRARVGRQRVQFAALQRLAAGGWQLLAEAEAEAAAEEYARSVHSAMRAAGPAAMEGEVLRAPVPEVTGEGATGGRRLLGRVAHVLCLPSSWSSGSGASRMRKAGLVRPRMLAPLLMATDRSGYTIGIPAGHADSRLFLSLQRVGSDTASATPVVHASGAGSSEDGLLSSCERVAAAVCVELTWDAFSVEAVRLREQLLEAEAGNRVVLEGPSGVGGKRPRQDARAVVVSRVAVGATAIEVHAARGEAEYVLLLTMRHAQEGEGGGEGAQDGGRLQGECVDIVRAAAMAGAAGPCAVLLPPPSRQDGPLTAVLHALTE